MTNLKSKLLFDESVNNCIGLQQIYLHFLVLIDLYFLIESFSCAFTLFYLLTFQP